MHTNAVDCARFQMIMRPIALTVHTRSLHATFESWPAQCRARREGTSGETDGDDRNDREMRFRGRSGELWTPQLYTSARSDEPDTTRALERHSLFRRHRVGSLKNDCDHERRNNSSSCSARWRNTELCQQRTTTAARGSTTNASRSANTDRRGAFDDEQTNVHATGPSLRVSFDNEESAPTWFRRIRKTRHAALSTDFCYLFHYFFFPSRLRSTVQRYTASPSRTNTHANTYVYACTRHTHLSAHPPVASVCTQTAHVRTKIHTITCKARIIRNAYCDVIVMAMYMCMWIWRIEGL